MIYLDSPAKSLMLVLDAVVATNQLDISLDYFDVVPQSTTTTRRGGVQTSSSNGISDVTISSAPATQGIIRNIHTIFINNKDTATRIVTVKLDDGGSQKILIKQTLASGDSLVYEDNRGWEVLTPITAPFVDTTEIVKGSLDASKRLRIEVDGITTGTTRVWTVADADIVVGGSASAMTAGRVVYTDTGGLLNASGSLTWTGSGTLALIGAQTISSTLGVTGTSTLGVTNTGAFTATTGSFSSTLGVTGHTTFEGVTSTGATGTGNLVYSISPTVTGTLSTANISATTTSSYGLTMTTAANAFVGMQLSRTVNTASSWDIYTPAGTTDLRLFANTADRLTLTNTGALTITGGLSATTGNFSSTLSVTGHTTFEGVTSAGATGTGNIVYSVAPTFTGTINGGTFTASGQFDNGGVQGATKGIVLGGLGVNYGRFIESANDNWQIGYSGTRTGAVTSLLAFTTSTATFSQNLTVSGTGPHSVGGATSTLSQWLIQGGFTPSAGTGYNISIQSSISPPVNQSAYAFDVQPTLVRFGSGTMPEYASARFSAPAVGGSATTITVMSTVSIESAPSNGATNWALNIKAGGTNMGGALTYGGVTLSNAVTGTGNMVLSASPTLSGTIGGAITFSGALTLSSALTYGGVALSNAVTGTGNMVLSASPTLSGTATLPSVTMAASANLTNGVTVTAGSYSTGSITVDYTKGPLSTITNGGAYTITNSASDGSQILLVTNNGSAGATTFTGFTASSNTGDPLTTTNTHKFMITLVRINSTSTYHVKALQ